MKEAKGILNEILTNIAQEKARKLAAREQMTLLRPQGVELFHRGATLLRNSGHPDRVLIAPFLNSMRGNQLFEILSSDKIEILLEINGKKVKATLSLSIHPQRLFEDELKPAISIQFEENVQDDDDRRILNIFMISQDGDMLNWKGQYCNENEIIQAQGLMTHLEANSPITNALPFDHPLLS